MQPTSCTITCTIGAPLAIKLEWIKLVLPAGVRHPLEDDGHTLGVWQHQLAARSGSRAGVGDNRVSSTKMAQIMRDVSAQAGVMLISEACKVRRIDFERTYMPTPDYDTLRPLCFPQGTRVGTPHETIIPAAFLPLVVARMGYRLTVNGTPLLFQQWLGTWASVVLRQPVVELSGVMNDRLFQYVSTFRGSWGPLAMDDEIEYPEDCRDMPPLEVDFPGPAWERQVDVLDDQVAECLVLDMIRTGTYSANVRYRQCAQCPSLLLAVEEIPGTPLVVTIEQMQ